MQHELVLTNARLVLADEVREGTLHIKDGVIADIGTSSSAPGAVDCNSDYLLPGLVELHTDNLEKHFVPRPGVLWPADSAVIAHDAEVAGAGITTVFDALRIGEIKKEGTFAANLGRLMEAIERLQDEKSLKAHHLIHVRCEISCEATDDQFAELTGHKLVRLASVMDHTPGQRQYVNTDKFREYQMGKYGLSPDEVESFIQERMERQAKYAGANRKGIVALAQAHGIPLASHDDATDEHVEEATRDRMAIAEFPTTEYAAALSREKGLKVLMGSPNVVRGGSHSGNVAAADLAAKGLLDILSSDYVPWSQLQAVFRLADEGLASLPQATAMASRAPAEAVGLTDRGEIAPGLRADIVRVTHPGTTPIVRMVWREGQRIA